ncbi:MAG: hypothetical protein EBU84_22165, partial [Actinobacteria bacterium]|nr:hypothetical protein [Actinomycetota bacterium]
MTQPASSPFLSKSRTRLVPYSNMVSGYTDMIAGDTTVLFVGDGQTLLGERTQFPSTGKPVAGVDWRLSIGTRIVIYAFTSSPAPSAHEIRVNYANNLNVSPATWMQMAIYPLIVGMPVSIEVVLTSAYCRIDLGCFNSGRAHWSIAMRGP